MSGALPDVRSAGRADHGLDTNSVKESEQAWHSDTELARLASAPASAGKRQTKVIATSAPTHGPNGHRGSSPRSPALRWRRWSSQGLLTRAARWTVCALISSTARCVYRARTADNG